MKNIHILPTDKPSRLFKVSGELKLTRNFDFYNGSEYQHIYITSDEIIKDVRPHKGKWQLEQEQILNKFPTYLTDLSECKLVIMTTDQELIKDGVQAIDDEFLEWFLKNPSCEFVKIVDDVECLPMPNIHIHKRIYKIIIPQEESKQENCCTPAGQIKRYVDCVGCDRKPKQMSKQTAVEWFNDEIIIHLNFDQRLYLKDILKQAKEMGKQQTIDAFDTGRRKGDWIFDGEKYYEETYKN